ncbi:MAG: DUF4326 domain-containing protein [Candidatus Aenigmarchaeota archaeon]|nr:DUF4326 domain-containing protein [Candidatus Aenigmarchaeota archaeon]
MDSLEVPTLCCVKIAELRKRGLSSFTEWRKSVDSLYIGRFMRIGSNHGPILIKPSLWKNPYKLTKERDNIDEVLLQYEDHIRNSPLIDRLGELSGKELGCWCNGYNPCHGDILIKLFCEKFSEQISDLC